MVHSSGTVTMTGGGVLDCAADGKAFGAQQAHLGVALNGVLVARCDTGGEFVATPLHMHDSHVSEIPDGDGVRNDDDNDGVTTINRHTAPA